MGIQLGRCSRASPRSCWHDPGLASRATTPAPRGRSARARRRPIDGPATRAAAAAAAATSLCARERAQPRHVGVVGAARVAAVMCRPTAAALAGSSGGGGGGVAAASELIARAAMSCNVRGRERRSDQTSPGNVLTSSAMARWLPRLRGRWLGSMVRSGCSASSLWLAAAAATTTQRAEGVGSYTWRRRSRALPAVHQLHIRSTHSPARAGGQRGCCCCCQACWLAAGATYVAWACAATASRRRPAAAARARGASTGAWRPPATAASRPTSPTSPTSLSLTHDRHGSTRSAGVARGGRATLLRVARRARVRARARPGLVRPGPPHGLRSARRARRPRSARRLPLCGSARAARPAHDAFVQPGASPPPSPSSSGFKRARPRVLSASAPRSALPGLAATPVALHMPRGLPPAFGPPTSASPRW